MLASALGYVPLGSVDDAAALSNYSLDRIPRNDQETYYVWMVEIDAGLPTTKEVPIFSTMDGPLGIGAIGATHTETKAEAVSTLFRFASRGFVCPDLDYIHVEGRLKPVYLKRELPTEEDGIFSAVARATVGDVLITNADAALDDFLQDYILENRIVRVYITKYRNILHKIEPGVFVDNVYEDGVYEEGGEKSEYAVRNTIDLNFADFQLVFTGHVDNVVSDLKAVSIKIRDVVSRLERPLKRNRYQDFTGDQSDGAGRYLPIVLGVIPNMEAVRIHASKLVYQVNDGPVFSIDAVRDSGVPLQFVRDYRTRKELFDASSENFYIPDDNDGTFDIDLGQYATCLREGLFRVGGLPIGVVTADVRGLGGYAARPRPFSDGTKFTDGTGWVEGTPSQDDYIDDAAGIGLRIIQRYTETDVRELINESSWYALQRDVSATRKAGFYIKADSEYDSLGPLNLLLSSINACAAPDAQGKLSARRFVYPRQGRNQHEFKITASQIKRDSLRRTPLPYGFPFAVWRAYYALNNRVMTDAEIATSIQGSARQYLLLPGKSVDAVDTELRQLYSDRGARIYPTALMNREDALLSAEEKLQLYGRGRRMFECVVYGLEFQINVLSIVRLEFPRFNLDEGQNFLAVTVQEESSGRGTYLRLW